MLTNIVNLINKAKKNGVSVFLDDGKVKLAVAKKAVVEDGLIEQIKKYKAEIKEFLDGAALERNGDYEAIEPLCAQFRSEARHIPLSFGQERLWFVDQFEGSVQYHLHWELRLKGTLNIDALECALKSIVNRHEILRTVIAQDESGLEQRVMEPDRWQLNKIDYDTKAGHSESLGGFVEDLIHATFDLSTDHMIRASLIELAPKDFLLVVVIHHIVADAWSMTLIARELVEFYQSYIEGRSSRLPALELQYGDFAIWQRKYLQGELLHKSLQYWQQRLTGVVPLLLPVDNPRSVNQSTKGEVVRFHVEKGLVDVLQSLCKERDVTMFMLLLAIYQVLLHRYSGQESICVGVPIAGRDQQEIQGLVGFFINTLAFHNDLHPDLPFGEFLQQVKENALLAFEHQDIPYDKVVEALNLDRDRSRNALFDAKFSYEAMTDASGLQLEPGVEVMLENFGEVKVQLDLSMDVRESIRGLQVELTYRQDLFKEESMIRMGAHFKQLLTAVAKDADTQIGDLQMLTSQDRDALASFNDTFVDYPRNKTIIDVFDAQVEKYSDQIALIFDDQYITYKELDERASRLGAYLRKKGVGRDVLVPVCKEKSVELIVGIFAVMKAGGAYVPLDPEFPADRIGFVVRDCNAKLALVGSGDSLREKFTGGGCGELELISLDDDTSYRDQKCELAPINASSDLAYCIYTSGTTGQPKGVMIEHQGLVNVSLHHVHELKVVPQDRVMQFFASVFDASVLDIFTALSAGAALVIPPQEIIQDAGRFLNYLDEKEVTIFTLTPSYLSLLGRAEMPSVRILITGGEACKVEDALYYSKFKKFYNAYGPSEVTVNATLYNVDAGKRHFKNVPIGRPSDNKYIHIIRDRMLCPVGITGEICIGGAGLSRGYLNNEQLTEEKFIPDPFRSGARLYRTGDLGRWLGDGNIEYSGRMDDQVKIRGFRIEPGEIESVLLQSGLVDQAVVLARGEGADNLILTAYVVAKGKGEKQAILRYLSGRLPTYMVPSVLYEMDSIPLTTNGKANRSALPDPTSNPYSSTVHEAPETIFEKTLAQIWEELLGVSGIGIYADFFASGGHSLMAIKMISAIRKKMFIDVSISDIFDHLTIKELAAFLESEKKPVLLQPIEKRERPAFIPLSFAQERLWFVDQLEGSRQYHIPIVLKLRGQLDIDALNDAFATIVSRHEILRTVIAQRAEEVCQVVLDAGLWMLDVIDETYPDQEALQSRIDTYVYRPFDLSKDHLIRAAVICLSDEEHLLIVVLHHLVVDGWSLMIMERELIEGYNSRVQGRALLLPELPVQYADYAIWQRKYLAGEVLEKGLEYWREKLEGVLPLVLPADLERRPDPVGRGEELVVSIDKDTTSGIRALSLHHDATLFMFMLTAFKVLLYRYTGQEDICVCGAIAHRTQPEVAGLIGLFINMLALRDHVDGGMNFLELLEAVKATTREAYEHQEAPFEKVAETFLRHRDRVGRDLFQIWFLVQNESEIASRINDSFLGLEAVPVIYGGVAAKSDIGVTVVEKGETLSVMINYNADLYFPGTISRLANFYRELLKGIIANPLDNFGMLGSLLASGRNESLSNYVQIDKHSLFNFD